MAIDPNFSSIHTAHFSDTAKDSDKALRTTDGNALYTHTKMSSSTVARALGLGRFVSQDRIDARETKKQDGASLIKKSLDREFGAGFGDRVFKHIMDGGGKNMAEGVTRRDLGTIKSAADELQAHDALFKSVLGGVNLSEDGALQTVRNAVTVLGDPSYSDMERSLVADTLRLGFLDAGLDDFDSTFHTGGLKSRDLRAALTASYPNGERVFSVADMRDLMSNTLGPYSMFEDSATFMRSASPTSVIMSETINAAGDGRIFEIQKDVKGMILENRGDYTDTTDPIEMKIDTLAAIDQIDTYFKTLDLGGELTSVFADIREMVEDSKDSHGWSGSDFAANTLMLRGMVSGELIASIRADTGMRSGGKFDPGADVLVFLQRTVNAGDTFQDHERAYMEDKLAEVRTDGSGLNALLDQVRA